MRLTEEEQAIFKQLSSSPLGQTLAEYLERALSEETDIENLTEDNLKGKKYATQFIRQHIISQLIGRDTESAGDDNYS